MYENFKLPDASILGLVSAYDARETLEHGDKWPRSYYCKQVICPKCGEPLSPLTKRKQKNISDQQLLITKGSHQKLKCANAK